VSILILSLVAPVWASAADAWMRSVAAPTAAGVLVSDGADDEVPGETETAAKEPVATRSLGDFRGYRVSSAGMSWTLGDGDQFGSFALEANPYLEAGIESGLVLGLGFRFLSGPERTDMPPRVYDFSVGYQTRGQISDLAFDLSTVILAASDFEGSSRDGIRLPAHAVGYLTFTNDIDLVFGVDYLDRDDIHILPVGGLVIRPGADVRIELVFPRPRVEFQLTSDYRLYFRGGLGGGTWAVERDSELDDLASLYELQFGVGLARACGNGGWSALEFVYLFDRKLEYVSGMGDYHIGPTMMIRAATLSF
jgi:hypothetical protein